LSVRRCSRRVAHHRQCPGLKLKLQMHWRSIDAAHTGSSGDGIVAILPVYRVFSVRTRSDTIPNRATEAFAGASRQWAQPTENGGQREWSR